MKKILISVLIATATCFVIPGFALAQGNSAVDQYVENVPDASGGGSGAPSGGNGGGSSLPQSSAESLESAGSDGAAAANLAEETAPPSDAVRTTPADGDQANGNGQANQGTNSSQGGNPSAQEDPTPVSTSPASSSSSERTDNGSDGIGFGLPIFLGVVLLGAVVFLVARKLRDRQEGAAART